MRSHLCVKSGGLCATWELCEAVCCSSLDGEFCSLLDPLRKLLEEAWRSHLEMQQAKAISRSSCGFHHSRYSGKSESAWVDPIVNQVTIHIVTDCEHFLFPGEREGLKRVSDC